MQTTTKFSTMHGHLGRVRRMEISDGIRSYGGRLAPGNVPQVTGGLEAYLRRKVRAKELPPGFVFKQMRRQERDEWQGLLDRKASIGFEFMPPDQKFSLLATRSREASNGQAPAETMRAIALAGKLFSTAEVKAKAETGEPLYGKTPREWVDTVVRPMFMALANKTKANPARA